ncbi:MAG TPA: lytic transglycosylase domain-containing protein [Candidatus Binataceae bacterium]|nr:lytic transglycosylase domain-containing protein [Candidatus Binataceae bacterium]
MPGKTADFNRIVRVGLLSVFAFGAGLAALPSRVLAGADTIIRFPKDAEQLQPVTTPSVPAASLISAASTPTGTSAEFPRPPALEPNIKFWVDVFTAYGERDFLIHDKDQIWKIYEVQHLPGFGAPSREEVEATGEYLRAKYTDILGRLGAGLQPSDPDEQRVAALFKGEPLSAYTLAASNLRIQEGLREQYEEGLLRSRNYRAEMERIFVDEGLPPELVSLANIESDFYSTARSSAGAVGIWQFTRDTGKEYLRITRYHDDRFDPIAETRAAAELLRYNYDSLGSWPLAITAYNYGTGGMAEAAQLYGSDFGRIFRSYDGPHFGFASRNYYAEFLAALQIQQNEDAYFPDLKYEMTPAPQIVRTDFAPPRSVRHHGSLHRIAHHGRHIIHRRHLIASADLAPRPPHLELVVATRRRPSIHHLHHVHTQTAHAMHHHSHRHAIVADDAAEAVMPLA